jgi:hypothetical protein
MSNFAFTGFMLLALLDAVPALEQPQGDPRVLIAAQKEALKQLDFMDGVWRGPAWTILPNGQRHDITQTERVGPFLDGALKMMEGRGYEPDGTVSFNALAVVSYDPARKTYSMRSHAMGRSGDFELKLKADGFVWVIPAGPAMTIRYTATIKNGTWREVGERIAEGRAPVQFLEMNLKRIGDSDWPGAGAIPMK